MQVTSNSKKDDFEIERSTRGTILAKVKKLTLFLVLTLLIGLPQFFNSCSDVNFSSKQQQPSADDLKGDVASLDREVPDLEDQETELHQPMGVCKKAKFQQPDRLKNKSVDILFVVDTSGSLKPERPLIVGEISQFVERLPASVDYSAAVLYAHEKNGGLIEKEVLSSKDKSSAEIREVLTTLVKNPRTESSTDGGEAGLYAFREAITTRLIENRLKGFFREQAALAVVFISDENDICSYGFKPEGVEFVRDPDNKEIPAYNRLCRGDRPVNPTSILKDLMKLQGDKPYLVSSIIYTGENSFSATGENEIGYGYLEVTELADGLLLDLASKNFSQSMAEIGSLTATKLQLSTSFRIAQTENRSLAIKSVVVDGFRLPAGSFDYKQELEQVQIDADFVGGALSTIEINYCESLL